MTERKFLYYLMLYLVVSIGDGIMHIYCLYIHPLIADTLGILSHSRVQKI